MDTQWMGTGWFLITYRSICWSEYGDRPILVWSSNLHSDANNSMHRFFVWTCVATAGLCAKRRTTVINSNLSDISLSRMACSALEWRKHRWSYLIGLIVLRSMKCLVFGEMWSWNWTWFRFKLLYASNSYSKAQCQRMWIGGASSTEACDTASLPSKLCRMANQWLVGGKYCHGPSATSRCFG